MKIFWGTIVFVILVQFSFARAKTDANIIGHVSCNNEHVPFINVTVDGTTIGTTTDASGHFQLINLPVGNYNVRVAGIGYKSIAKEITAIPNNTIEIKFDVEEDILKLDEIVVSADRNQSNRAEASVVITSLKSQLFVKTQSTNIAEALCFSPGLRTENNCQNCGFTQLRMNGMEGPYTQILMNSRPVFSGLAGVYGLEIIPANMVERLEIIRGGGSALFGGNAIAGTVNIITKEPTRNTFSLDTRNNNIGIGNMHINEIAQDNQINLNASVVTDNGKSGGYIYGMSRNKDAYDENGDGFSESVMLDNTTFGFSMYHKPGAKSKISLDGYRLNEFRRGGNMLEYLPHESDITEQVRHLISGVNAAYDLFLGNNNKLTLYSAVQSVDRDSYYGAMQDKHAYGHTKDITSTMGSQLVLSSGSFLFGNSSTVFGIDNSNNKINDTKLGANGELNTTLTNQMVNTLGSFVQQDWKTDKFNLGIGLRIDNYLIRNFAVESKSEKDVSNVVLAPRISTLYKITPKLRFRLGFAKGYRAPQLFNEDFHIELVNAKRVFHLNADDLTQETSNSITASINYNLIAGATVNELLIETFYTKLNNPFADEYFQLDNEGTWSYRRVNAKDGAYVKGVNIEYNLNWIEKVELQIGFTVQQSKFETPQAWGNDVNAVTTNFVRSPNTYGYLTASCKPLHNFHATLTLNYTGSMYVPHFGLNPNSSNPLELAAIQNGDVIKGERLERSEKFLITDLLLSYDLRLTKETNIQLYTGLKNIFNQVQKEHDSGMFRDAGYIYSPYQPRTFNIGVKFGNVF